jgi:hypothetical protein
MAATGIDGGIDGGNAIATGGGGGPPVPTGTTTAAEIRDRMIAVITALTPSAMTLPRFQLYQHEGAGDFLEWAQLQPAAALRRFSVRTVGEASEPLVSNTDVELVRQMFEVVVAYPQTSRYGGQLALDRDDVAEADRLQIRNAIGLNGGANFIAPYPPAAFIEAMQSVAMVGAGVDFHIIRQVMEFWRAPLG